jgi:cytochrome P450
MVSPAFEKQPRLAENLRLVREFRPSAILPGLRDVATEAPGDIRRWLRQLTMLTVESSLEDTPGWLLALLRTFRPVLARGPVTLATRADDVLKILRDEETFTVRPYAHTMEHFAGPFVLGLDGAQHAAARGELKEVLASIDPTELRSWANDAAERLVTEHARDGQIDMVTDLAERLPARFVADYFGVPGPDEDTLISWSKTLFEGTFLNLLQRSLDAEAATVAAAMRAHIDELVSQTRVHEPAGRITVLQGLIAQTGAQDGESDNSAIATTLIGLVLAAIPTVSKATARAANCLLSSSGAFAGSRSAAQRDDHELLWRYVREALRFQPQTSALLRETAARTTLSAGTRHRQTIREHHLVLAGTASAMHDHQAVDEPRRFHPDRPDSDYLHFGAGPHRCLGEHIAPVLMTAAIAALFRRPGLRRLPGPAGRLVTEGRWPAHLIVAL